MSHAPRVYAFGHGNTSGRTPLIIFGEFGASAKRVLARLPDASGTIHVAGGKQPLWAAQRIEFLNVLGRVFLFSKVHSCMAELGDVSETVRRVSLRKPIA